MADQDAQIKELEESIAQKDKEIELLRAVLKEINKVQEKKNLKLESNELQSLEAELNNL